MLLARVSLGTGARGAGTLATLAPAVAALGQSPAPRTPWHCHPWGLVPPPWGPGGTTGPAVGLPLGDSGVIVGQGQNVGQGQDHNRGRSQSTMWGGTCAPGVEPGPHEQEVRTSPVLQEDAQPRGSPRQVTGPAAAPCPHPLPCCAGLPMPCTFWGLPLLSSQPGTSPTLMPHAEPPHLSARARSSCLSP